MGGGGGGGRIAVHYTTSDFHGNFYSFGGQGVDVVPGGPGTVYLKSYSSNGSSVLYVASSTAQSNNPISSINTTTGAVAWLTEAPGTTVRIDSIHLLTNAVLSLSPNVSH